MAGAKKPKKSVKRASAAKPRQGLDQENEFVRLGVICLTILAIVFLLMVLIKY